MPQPVPSESTSRELSILGIVQSELAAQQQVLTVCGGEGGVQAGDLGAVVRSSLLELSGQGSHRAACARFEGRPVRRRLRGTRASRGVGA